MLTESVGGFFNFSWQLESSVKKLSEPVQQNMVLAHSGSGSEF
jgi:hypothetical protein